MKESVVLRAYPKNSPAAVARVVAMMLVTDTEVDAPELAALERLDTFGRIGIARPEFMRVARDYCADLGALIGDGASIRLADAKLIDQVIAPVEDPALRLLTCRLLVGLIPSDGEVHAAEVAVFEHVLKRWRITHDELAAAIAAAAATHAGAPPAR